MTPGLGETFYGFSEVVVAGFAAPAGSATAGVDESASSSLNEVVLHGDSSWTWTDCPLNQSPEFDEDIIHYMP